MRSVPPAIEGQGRRCDVCRGLQAGLGLGTFPEKAAPTSPSGTAPANRPGMTGGYFAVSTEADKAGPRGWLVGDGGRKRQLICGVCWARQP